ncbi:MAG: LptF/LptG family permease [Phycisphaerales bacterium]|nr:LptF/LptG family permease [Phycisphaerales bacterium]
MMYHLQWYITRELLKTFALTAIGLTLIFSLCGGALNIIQADMLTAVQIAQLMAFVLPVATTLTLPISALFACAMVYGRLAADNEFDACKSSGINIHRLLAPAVGLSVFTAVFTFSFANYVIPKYIEQLDEMVRKDLQKVAVGLLRSRGYMRHGPYVLYAGHCELRPGEEEQEVLYIREAAFMELEGSNLVRVGTAEEVRVDFWVQPGASLPVVEACMYNVYGVDIKQRQTIDLKRQRLDPQEIPSQAKQNPKWLTLNELLYFQGNPSEMVTVRRDVEAFRRQVGEAFFYRDLVQQWRQNKVIRLGDERRRYEIQVDRLELDVRAGQVEQYMPRNMLGVTVQMYEPDRKITYQADSCAIRVNRGATDRNDTILIVLEGNVTFADPRNPRNVVTHRRQDLPALPFPRRFEQQVANLSDENLFGKGLPGTRELETMNLGRRIDEARKAIGQELVKMGLSITAIIHSRLAFSSSVLVMLVLAAGLAIICRGGQLLTAFVISFIPGMVIVVMNVMGRQLAEKPGTALAGVGVIWLGLVLLAVADAVVLTRYLRR